MACLVWSTAQAAAPRLDGLVARPDAIVELTGSFGPACAACEIWVEYDGQLRYAHAPLQWESHRIRFRVTDLNRPEAVRVLVKANGGASNALPLRVERRLEPPAIVATAVPVASLDNRHYFERSHRLSVGDKGEDVFDIASASPQCDRAAAVFDHARLVYRERRFGEALIVASPLPGCLQCDPLRVRWYHEPTGHLTYQVHVYRRVVEGVCGERLR